MQRYFVKNRDCTATGVRIADRDLHHIKNVMRMKLGAEIHVVDEDGRARLAVLKSYLEDAAWFEFQLDLGGETGGIYIAIAQALIKKDRFEWMLEKATELGVSEIIPTAFSRSVVKIDPADAPRKLERFQMIAKEAAEQSQRNAIPLIRSVTDLNDLPFAEFDRVYVCYEAATAADPLGKVVTAEDLDKRLLFIVGPEGGIAFSELAELKRRGAVVCGLGSRILRSETASMYILSALDAIREARN
ncbi:MAG TPA: 16S rRNA (uracil(1498)-N(3))-methyltransferase [Acholeplasmatales bacterium]|nr:MAG: hypothetical protein A2Y16_01890 [Tenericutes bacterium GWF2_57_13]HAQ57083.1 16S rRNA (uracil(1498)-N(3))-methyltransferase [Acholeplasmatales bacterium]